MKMNHNENGSENQESELMENSENHNHNVYPQVTKNSLECDNGHCSEKQDLQVTEDNKKQNQIVKPTSHKK